MGKSEESVRRAIAVAETLAPCILWIDEVEKGLSGVRASGELDSGVTARVVGTLLTWMQEKTSPVFMATTANDVSKLPPELLRKGRFDEIFFVDLPDVSEREEIVRIQLRKRNRSLPEGVIKAIAQEAEVKTDDGRVLPYTGAEIEQAVIAGLYECYEDGKRNLTGEDIKKALKGFVPLATTMREQIDALREWGKNRAKSASGKVISLSALPSGLRPPTKRKVEVDESLSEKAKEEPKGMKIEDVRGLEK
jgi:SpoVK/Ycf46/Vps4 family AAA+-type ATPase